MTDLESMPEGFVRLHADAAQLLRSYHPSTEALARTRDRMAQVLASDPTAMWRAHSPVHFTASIVVLSPGLDEVALTLHRKAKRWFQFGGHFEATDATVTDAARREGTEESGLSQLRVAPGLLQVDAHELPAAFGHCREHLDLRFAARAVTRELVRSEESMDVAWWPIDALPDDTDASLRQAVQLARKVLAPVG